MTRITICDKTCVEVCRLLEKHAPKSAGTTPALSQDGSFDGHFICVKNKCLCAHTVYKQNHYLIIRYGLLLTRLQHFHKVL